MMMMMMGAHLRVMMTPTQRMGHTKTLKMTEQPSPMMKPHPLMTMMLEDVVATRRTDGWTCPLGVCSYVLETLDVAHLARN